MKIVCLIKFVPDVEEFKYDYQRHVLIRENLKQILNPDDACAVACALMIKRSNPETVIEVVTMAPVSVSGHLEDLLRLNIDQAILISDIRFSGSDTFATTRVLARYLKQTTFDVILTGTHSLDGSTAQVPSQLAEVLGLPQMSNVVALDTSSFLKGKPSFDVEHDTSIMTFSVDLPAILSVSRDSAYKLPYVAYQDLNRDVSSRIRVLSHQELDLQPQETGLEGSRTEVRRSFVKNMIKKDKVILNNDREGIEAVYCYLHEHGFVP